MGTVNVIGVPPIEQTGLRNPLVFFIVQNQIFVGTLPNGMSGVDWDLIRAHTHQLEESRNRRQDGSLRFTNLGNTWGVARFADIKLARTCVVEGAF